MVSVITLTYNNFEELLETVQSLENVIGIESVIVNGGGCEKTKNFLSSYRGTVVSEKDQGISDAFNKGIQASKGDFVAFLNSGDRLLDPLYYSDCERFLNENTGFSYVYSNLHFEDPLAGKTIFKGMPPSLQTIGRGQPFPHPSMVVKKPVFEKTGPFDLRYRIAMDYEWSIRLMKQGVVGKYFDRLPVWMEGTGISSLNQKRSLAECRQALSEHGIFSGQVQKEYRFRAFKMHAQNVLRKTLGNPLIRVLKKIRNRHFS